MFMALTQHYHKPSWPSHQTAFCTCVVLQVMLRDKNQHSSAVIQPLHSPTLSTPSPGTRQTWGNSLISPAITESNVWSGNLPEKHSGFQEGVQ